MNKNNKPWGDDTPSILVIDDEISICEFFTDLFEIYAIKIDTEQTGKSGIERALKNHYTLIFLDVMLGDINGIDVLTVIKNKRPATNIIMISAYLTEELIEKALKLGADGYLYKPIAVRDIISVTMRFLNIKHLKNKQDKI